MPTLPELLASWQDLRWTFDPAAGTRAGAEGQDGRLPAFDAEGVKLQLAGIRSLAGAVELLDLEDDGEEIDRTALLDVLRATTFRLEHEIHQRRNPAAWVGAIANAWQSIRSHQNGTPVVRAQAALDRLEGAPELFEKASKSMKGPATVFVEEAIELAPAARVAARQLASEASGWLPGLSERLRSASEQAELAVAAFEHRLREDVSPSADPSAFAIGREAFDHRLHFEHALRPTSPELWRWAQHSLEESRATAVEAARAAGLGDDLHAAAKQMRAAHPAADAQAEMLRALARARRWVEGRGLLTLPAAELRVLEMPELVQLSAGAVRFEEDDVVYVRPASVPTAPASSAERVVEVLLEICPGKLTHRSIAKGLQAPVRRALATPCSVDGWALYGLDLALSDGFTESAEEVFAIRLAQLHAAARAVVDIGLHTEGFTPVAATELLMQLLPIERGVAAADVRHAASWPTYAMAAAVGRREIVQLRDAWRSSGDRSGPHERGARVGREEGAVGRSFHDTLLSYGGLPISLARWGMDLGLEE